VTTPPPDPFGAPREGEGRPTERPSWDAQGTDSAPPQQGPSYGRQPDPWQSGQSYGQPGQSYGQPGQSYGPPVHGYGRPPAWQGPTATGSKAIIALVCAIASWVVLPLLPAIAALLIARSARQEIAGSGGRLTGGGMVTAAKVIAWANVVATVLAVLLVAAAIALFATTASDLQFS
jgi:hypothetical protein